MPLDDPRWEGIGVYATLILSVLAIIIPLGFWWLYQRSVKALTYSVAITKLYTAEAHAYDEIKVSFQDKEIRKPTVTILELRNSGQADILAVDFADDIRIEMPRSTPLQVTIDKKDPDALKPHAEIDVTEVGLIRVKPLLLNKGDMFILKILDADAEPNIVVKGRIAGVKDIKIMKGVDSHWIFTVLPIINLVFLAVYLYFYYGRSFTEGGPIQIILWLTIMIFGAMGWYNGIKSIWTTYRSHKA